MSAPGQLGTLVAQPALAVPDHHGSLAANRQEPAVGREARTLSVGGCSFKDTSAVNLSGVAGVMSQRSTEAVDESKVTTSMAPSGEKERLLIAAPHLASVTRCGGEMSLNCRAVLIGRVPSPDRELPLHAPGSEQTAVRRDGQRETA